MYTIITPGGISAIFDPYIYADPIISGARGAGVGVDGAVEITLSIRDSDRLEITNIINGNEVRGGIGEISVKTFFEIMRIEPKYRVEINQRINIPIGAGFGTSAASALGIIMLLSRALKVPLTLIEAGDIAHIAEIRAGSGLGTVSGIVYLGDIVIVSRAGAPSICLVDRIILEGEDIYVVLASKGKKETAIALRDKKLIERASMYEKILDDRIMANPTVENFFQTSRLFAENTGLMTKEIKATIDALEDIVIGVSQAMIGDSIFALVFKENMEEAKDVIRIKMGVEPCICRLVRSGFKL